MDGFELASPGVMMPDTTMSPLVIENEAMNGHVRQVVGPDEESIVLPGQKPGKSPTPLQDSLRRLRRDKRAMVSLAVIVLFILIPIFGPLIYQHIGGIYDSPFHGKIRPNIYHSPFWQELDRQDELFSGQYWLGTDAIGRDLLARLMQGMLVSIMVALLVEIVDVTLGITIGVLAGFYGGWIDQLLARFTDIMFAFPGLLLVIMAAATLGPIATARFGIVGRLLVVAIILGITIWPQMARFVRGQTLQIREQQYIEASRTVGGKNRHLILRHIVPNLFSIVIAAATLNIVGTITGEAVISLLGLGVQPPGSSLGLMISEGTQVVTTYPFEVLFPCVALVLLVVCLAFFGDGVRDAFDPRTKD